MGSSKFAALKAVREERSSDDPDDVAAINEPKAPASADQPPKAERSRKVEQPSKDEAPRRGRPPGKRSDESYGQVTAYIRKDIHHAVKLELLRTNDERDFSELVDELLASWIENPDTR